MARWRWLGCLMILATMPACEQASVSRTSDIEVDTSAVEGRGSIISQSLSKTVTLDDAKSQLTQVSSVLADTAKYPVLFYKIIYETIDPFGMPTQASGTLAIPQGAQGSLPLVSYQHGTVVYKKYGETSSEVNLIPLILAASGYVAVVPDYLGLGDSPGRHPYLHATSLATAVIDMLRAARQFAQEGHVALNDYLFLFGYSEGGYATMAAHHEIESAYSSEFKITASAPMAGPYDLSGTMAERFLRDLPIDNPYYLAYVVLAYNDVYGLEDSLADILLPEYAAILPDLFDGTHFSDEINQRLPAVAHRILNPDFESAFVKDPAHPFRMALQENDLDDWKPRALMHLYHCRRDEQVPFENSQLAYNHFIANGAAQVSLVEGDGGSHAECAGWAIWEAKQWFDGLATPL